MGITHAKVSGIGNDSGAPTLVGGEDWDDPHTITGTVSLVAVEKETANQGPTATPVGVTDVPGMAGVAVTLGATSTVIIRYRARVTRVNSGSQRNVYSYSRTGGASAAHDIYSYNGGEVDLQFVVAEWVETGTAAGTYTYKATYRASGGTSNSTFEDQHLIVMVIPE